MCENIENHSINCEMNEDCINELPKSIKFAIDHLVSTLNVDRHVVSFKRFSERGENSYGAVLQVKVILTEGGPQFSYIAKISPKNDARRKQMDVVEYYTREVFMYRNVISEYMNLQMEHGVPFVSAFSGTPAMYYSSLKERDEFIILEDLHNSGYSRFNRHHALSFRFVALAMEELAKFHAMSFALKEKKPKLFKELVRTLQKDHLFNDNMEQLKIDFGEKYIHKVITALNEMDDIPYKRNFLRHLRYFCSNFKDIGIKMVNGSEAEPFAVICHGDFWNNNILYRYDKTGNPVSAKLLDFQMSRYASPILDIVHYLFVCTEKKLRDDHFDDFKRIYHTSLSNHLKLFDLEVEQIFSYSSFEEQLRKFGVYGFCISVYALPFYISDACHIPDLNEAAEAAKTVLNAKKDDKNRETDAYLSRYDFLNQKTLEIFNMRMIGILFDLEKYDMFVENI